MSIRIIITGGTFDKNFNKITGGFEFEKSHLPEMLKQAMCTVGTVLETVMLKDSLYMTEDDRQQILARCQGATEDRIIITHGTDTMVETARVLGNRIKDKTIVMIGAMIPYSLIYSDALFNLGCAIAAVQALAPGVYITINGKIFTWDKVRKNKQIGEFEELPAAEWMIYDTQISSA